MAGVEPADEPNDDLGALRPGTRLGRYELLVPVARGGMARVWAARQHGQHGFHKLVAIKTILAELASEPEFERMFLDEARIASAVHHPNVCEIYELGEDQKTLFLAMEWVSGDSLARLLRPGAKSDALDPRIAARIIADACAGVHAAHEQTDEDGKPLNVVHRDLSPHNVLLTTDGVVKVCDFGVAKALGQVHLHTRAGEVKGKIAYMSPEQITQGGLDRRSDVFSLGCVLYEATTGARPFKGSEHQVMYAILHDELASPSSVLRNYPPELERIVLRALAHEPANRFPSAERMRIALEEFLTKGQLVTQSNVAQVVRARLGDELDKRRERIRQASTATRGSDPGTDAKSDQSSGVKVTSQLPAAKVPPPKPPPEAPASAEPPQKTLEELENAETDLIPRLASQKIEYEEDEEDNNPKTLLMVSPFSAPQQAFPPAPPASSAQSMPISPPRPYDSQPRFEPAPMGYGMPRRGTGEEESMAGQYALAALVGVVFAVLIGGGGFLIWRAHTMRTAPPAMTAPP